MTDELTGGAIPSLPKHIDKLFQMLDIGLCTFDEFANTLTDAMMRASEHIPTCIARMSEETLTKYAGFLRDLLLPVDFMPYPGGHMVRVTDENIKATKQVLRPKYLYLFQIVEDAVERRCRN